MLIVIAGGCRPRDQKLLVANVEGDVFAPALTATSWKLGAGMDCQVASRTSIPPDERGDLLLCGGKTQLAWAQTWLRPDIKNQIYNAAKKEVVQFHSSGGTGHGGKYSPPIWRCKRMPDGIECD